MLFDGLGNLPTYDEPLDTDLLIRQSTIESMMLCPTKVGLSLHPDYDSTPSEAMFFGTVIHATIEWRLLNGPHLCLSSPAWVTEFIRGLATDDGFNLDDVATATQIKTMADQAIVAYQTWEQQWWAFKGPAMKPLAIEQRLIRPLGTLPNGRAVWVHGTPDVLHQPGMVDWKTAGRGWELGRATTRIQTPTYLWLGETIRGVREGIGEYIVYDRSRQEWSVHPVPVTEDTIQAALRTLWEYSRMIDAQVFPPTPNTPTGRPGRGWWCSVTYCNAWNLCPYKALVADDRNLVEVRISSWAA